MSYGFSRDQWYNYIADRSHPPVASAVVEKPEYDPDHVYAWRPANNYKGWKLIARGKARVDDAEVIQKALDSLTPNRTWKEVVALRGRFVLSNTIYLDSYTVFDLRGAVLEQNFSSARPIIMVDGKEQVDIKGGILDGKKTSDNADTYGWWGIRIKNSKDVNIEGVYVKDTNFQNVIFEGNCERCSIRNSILKGGENALFVFSADSSQTLRDCVIEDCILDGGTPLANRPTGVDFWREGVSRCVARNLIICNTRVGIGVTNCQDNAISDVTIANITSSGIIILDGHRIEISNPVILNAGRYGIEVTYEKRGTTKYYSDHVKILGGIIYSPAGHGIFVYECDHASIQNVHVIKAGNDGIYYQGDHGVITGNPIEDANQSQGTCYGIHLRYATYTVVANNCITGDLITNSIYEDTGADYNLITNNIVNKAINKQGANTVVRRNLGYLTENSGTAKVTGNGTDTTFTVDITHGLVKDKAVARITLDREGTVDKVYLVDKDGDGFKETLRVVVTYATAPADGEEVPIYWYAEVV